MASVFACWTYAAECIFGHPNPAGRAVFVTQTDASVGRCHHGSQPSKPQSLSDERFQEVMAERLAKPEPEPEPEPHPHPQLQPAQRLEADRGDEVRPARAERPSRVAWAGMVQ